MYSWIHINYNYETNKIVTRKIQLIFFVLKKVDRIYITKITILHLFDRIMHFLLTVVTVARTIRQ